MTAPIQIDYLATDTTELRERKGRIAVFVAPDGRMGAEARRVNSLTRRTLTRLSESDAFEKLGAGQAIELAWPAGLAAEALVVVKLPRRPSVEDARKAGAAIARAAGKGALLVLAGVMGRAEEVGLGIALRAYGFTARKSEPATPRPPVEIMVADPEETGQKAIRHKALAEGILFTRDLVNEPANHLTTTEFAARIEEMAALGLKVEILEEDALKELGMDLFLSVGQGSASPTKLAIMEWQGGGDEPPLALVGKGVVFDTGGYVLKPGAGMEAMTMDMGGAGVVAGVMRTLALRNAQANVVGLVGLVENMISDRATRPGDVVTSMKGDTVEIINTDAEGRLVLADVLWYAQERFAPAGVIDLATLTGAIIIALGHENAGVFSNNDTFSAAFLKAAAAEGEGAWRLPLGQAYSDQLKSAIADVKNVGGRPAGSVTAAAFLQRFIKDDMPWIHLDIAGVASVKSGTTLAPRGATGWGVLALDRLVADGYEG